MTGNTTTLVPNECQEGQVPLPLIKAIQMSSINQKAPKEMAKAAIANATLKAAPGRQT
jgi:hypothetical protein